MHGTGWIVILQHLPYRKDQCQIAYFNKKCSKPSKPVLRDFFMSDGMDKLDFAENSNLK